MAIKAIVELQAKPGRREELRRVLESLIATSGPGQPGFLGSTRYGVPDDPNVLVEIADWESAEAREAHMKEAAAAGAGLLPGCRGRAAGPSSAECVARAPASGSYAAASEESGVST
jgi:quinol monooxygenase YgiN